MDEPKNPILRELPPPEKEVVAPRAGEPRQEDAPDHLSRPVLLERAAYLGRLARAGEGSASETLKQYPGHSIMLLYRGRSGEAELHENFADLFLVLDGRATLLTGGSIRDSRTTAPGEVRGAAIEGGARQELRAGDLAHVPRGLAHQMVVSGDDPVICLVVKIRQEP